MTIDKEQIRALAEQVIAEQKVSFGNAAMAAFHEAANPATVLALLDEIEQLSKNPFAQVVDAIATAAARHLATEAKGCVEKGLLETIEQVKAENEALRSQVAALQAEPNSYQSGFDAGRVAEKAHADNWRAEAEGLRKDAERYRWLRDESEAMNQFYLSTPIWFTGVKFSKESVDATIDAAIAKEAGHE